MWYIYVYIYNIYISYVIYIIYIVRARHWCHIDMWLKGQGQVFFFFFPGFCFPGVYTPPPTSHLPHFSSSSGLNQPMGLHADTFLFSSQVTLGVKCSSKYIVLIRWLTVAVLQGLSQKALLVKTLKNRSSVCTFGGDFYRSSPGFCACQAGLYCTASPALCACIW